MNDSGDGHAIPGSKKRSESIPRVYHAALLVRRAVRAGCREVVSGNDRKSGLRADLNDIKHLRGKYGLSSSVLPDKGGGVATGQGFA